MSNAAAAPEGGSSGGRGGPGQNNGGGRGGGGRGTGRGGGGRGGGGNRQQQQQQNRRTFGHGVDNMKHYQFGVNTKNEPPMVTFNRTKKEYAKQLQGDKRIGASNIHKAIANMDATELDVTIPTMPPTTITQRDAGGTDVVVDNTMAVELWRMEAKVLLERKHIVAELAQSTYGEIIKLCSENVRSLLTKRADWNTIDTNKCPVRLLEVIRLALFNSNGKTHEPTLIHALTQSLYCQKQGGMSNKDWYESRVAMVDAIESIGGSVTYHKGLIEEAAAKLAEEDGRVDADGVGVANDADIEAATSEIKGVSMGALVLCGSSAKNDEFKAGLANDFRNGNDNYPTSGAQALEDMSCYINMYSLQREAERRRDQHLRDREQQNGGNDAANVGLGFMQHRGAEEVSTDVETASPSYAEVVAAGAPSSVADDDATDDVPAAAPADDVPTDESAPLSVQDLVESGVCAHCGDPHPLSDCPDLTDEDLQAILAHLTAQEERVGEMLFQDGIDSNTGGGGLKSNYLYLDTCTTDNVMGRRALKYLTGLHAADKPLILHTNGGDCSTSQRGFLDPNLVSALFWYARLGIANVVSLCSLEKDYHVTYDSRCNGGAFICATPSGQVVFRRCEETGFPYIDLDEHSSDDAVLLVQTVRRNYEGFTRREVERAIEARRLQTMTGHPSEATFRREENKCVRNPTGLNLSSSLSLSN